MSYVIKCDECKTTIGETDDLGVSAAGGRCQACKPIPYGEPCGMCGRAAETPWTDEEYACYECAGDPKAKSVREGRTMNSTINPDRIIATNIRTTAKQLEAWRDLYATTYPTHRLSFNAWMVAMHERGESVPQVIAAMRALYADVQALPDVRWASFYQVAAILGSPLARNQEEIKQ